MAQVNLILPICECAMIQSFFYVILRKFLFFSEEYPVWNTEWLHLG